MAHLSAVNLTVVDARHKLTMCLHDGRRRGDLKWPRYTLAGTDRRCCDDKADERSE